jgi:hypothetical protein
MKFIFIIFILSLNAWSQDKTGIQQDKDEVAENLKKEKCKVIGINHVGTVGGSTISHPSSPGTIKN